jgi:hypothetical protein
MPLDDQAPMVEAGPVPFRRSVLLAHAGSAARVVAPMAIPLSMMLATRDIDARAVAKIALALRFRQARQHAALSGAGRIGRSAPLETMCTSTLGIGRDERHADHFTLRYPLKGDRAASPNRELKHHPAVPEQVEPIGWFASWNKYWPASYARCRGRRRPSGQLHLRIDVPTTGSTWPQVVQLLWRSGFGILDFHRWQARGEKSEHRSGNVLGIYRGVAVDAVVNACQE